MREIVWLSHDGEGEWSYHHLVETNHLRFTLHCSHVTSANGQSIPSWSCTDFFTGMFHLLLSSFPPLWGVIFLGTVAAPFILKKIRAYNLRHSCGPTVRICSEVGWPCVDEKTTLKPKVRPMNTWSRPRIISVKIPQMELLPGFFSKKKLIEECIKSKESLFLDRLTKTFLGVSTA